MKKLCVLLSLLLCMGSFCSCSAEKKHSSTFYLMDTLIGVTLYTSDAAYAREVFEGCEALLGELEGLWARQKPESEIARFNASTEGVSRLDARTVALLETALEVSAATEGAFDITVTPLAELWEICGKEDRLPTDAEMKAALALVDYSALHLSDGGLMKSDGALKVDLGGIGKGAAISLLIDYLKDTDVRGGLVSFGSNVAVFGEKPDGKPFRVALRHPRDERGTVGTLTMSADTVLSVSGDYERYVTVGGERYHHILNPHTGYPSSTGLASVAVLAEDGALADALSTALFVMGEERAMDFYASEMYKFEAVFVDENGNIRVTEGLRGLFVQED